MSTFEEKYQEKLEKYNKAFRLDELNDANDRSSLEIMIKTEVMIDDVQESIQDLLKDGSAENITAIKKLHDLLKDATVSITMLQKTLNIDRKTRKSEEVNSPADYIRALKRNAKDFMDQRIVKTYCSKCKVLVGRIYPVHDHTAFSVSFQCSQCQKMIRARRDERDIFFDVKDHQWRRAHRAEIVQPKPDKFDADDIYTGKNAELVLDDGIVLEVQEIDEELELMDGTD